MRFQRSTQKHSSEKKTHNYVEFVPLGDNRQVGMNHFGRGTDIPRRLVRLNLCFITQLSGTFKSFLSGHWSSSAGYSERDLFYGRCQSARADRFLLLSVRNSRRRQDATESHTFYMLNTLNLFLFGVFCLASKIPFRYFKL